MHPHFEELIDRKNEREQEFDSFFVFFLEWTAARQLLARQLLARQLLSSTTTRQNATMTSTPTTEGVLLLLLHECLTIPSST